MKLADHFNDLLRDTVNIDDTRLKRLDDSAEALKAFVRDSDWKPRIRGFAEQGSWAHGTIIKPIKDKAFDADLLVLVDPVKDWSARDYISELRRIFSESGTYQDKVKRYSHCVTIEYAGERKIDIAPCIVDRKGWASYEVCNFNSNEYEPSEPEKYTTWLTDRNRWTGLNGLKKITRLLKYLRDIKQTFTCPSFLFTTLLGERITSLDQTNNTDFSDVPTSLKTMVGRLDDWLQQQNGRPSIPNPVLRSEDLSGVWTDAQFDNFRTKIHDYREWIDDAYNETDRDESIGKWRRVFGDEFASAVTVEKGAHVLKEARVYLHTSALTPPGFTGDLIDLLRRIGHKAIPPFFKTLPHKERPKWRRATQGTLSVSVVATLHSRKNGPWVRDLTGDDPPLPQGHWIQFQLRTSAGMPLAVDYEIHWRITNTDEAAYLADGVRGLRGGFLKANAGTSHWEHLEYRGVHMAEAFVVRKRDRALVAESPTFYVPIE
jgi:hypothetical protein